jgi:hypothetical protein
MTMTDIACPPDLAPQSAQAHAPGLRDRVATLMDLGDALETAACSGQPSLADWPHRAMDFRILAQVLEGLEHPVEDFGALLPDDWAQVAPGVRARIPGNPTVNHKRLVSRMKRAIGWFRPDLDPWSALQLLAEVEIPVNADIVGEVRLRAARDGLRPSDIDTAWIAEQLAPVSAENEVKQRSLYQFLVRLSRRPRVQRTGLLRCDLAMPATRRQQLKAVVLPHWLQESHTAGDQRARNALAWIWRTILHHEMQADTPDDLLALIDAGKLSHDAACCVEPVKKSTWRNYVQCARKALLARVDDPTRYAKKIRHVDTPRKPRRPRRKKPETERAGVRLAREAVRMLQPPIAADADVLLTRDVWPRVATSMHLLGHERGLSRRTVDAYIEEAKRLWARQATRPVPARLPKTIRTPRPTETAKPNRVRAPSRVPALPAALCAEVHEMLDLCGYRRNAKRAMLARLGKGYTAGLEAKAFLDDATLEQVVSYMARHMAGHARTDGQQMSEVIGMCSHPGYRDFLAALRRAGISKTDDPAARLYRKTRSERPPSTITREWAWAHERSLAPDPRKTFSKAIDQLDALHAHETLVPLLPAERIGPLQASALRRGKRHQHARYPLPRRIEAEAAALDLDPDGMARFELIAGLHTLYDAARTAGEFQPGQEIGCAELLCSARLDAIARADVVSQAALSMARRRTSVLRPDERYATPGDRWRTLHAQVKAASRHNPRPDGTGERIPGFYAVRRAALDDGLGPEALTSCWAHGVLAHFEGDRAKRSGFRSGLRLLQAWRVVPDIEAGLVPPECFADDLIAKEAPVPGRGPQTPSRAQ